MKITSRGIHRDFAYFYVGLIIAFSFSGIILNHRQDWYPMDYTYEIREVNLVWKGNEPSLQEIKSWASEWDVRYDSHRIRNNSLRVYFKSYNVLDLNLENGEGKLELKNKVPLLGHTMYLHKSTSNSWIWYSDIFGAAMLTIAFTGLFIPTGSNGFRKRGWKLALAGILFPLVFLFIIS